MARAYDSYGMLSCGVAFLSKSARIASHHDDLWARTPSRTCGRVWARGGLVLDIVSTAGGGSHRRPPTVVWVPSLRTPSQRPARP